MSALSGQLDRYKLSVRVFPSRGGPVANAVYGDARPLELAACRHILLLVHGFNNTAEQADAAYNAMIGNLTPDLLQRAGDRPDAVVCLQWPGDAAVGPFQVADAIGYPTDIERAKRSAERIADYLRQLCAAHGPNFRISLIAHSLGCRLVLEALKRSAPGGLQVQVAALMAPAVPVRLVDASLVSPASLAGTDALARSMLKYHSCFDAVLGVAFPAGQALAFATGIEPEAYGEAVGFFGDPVSFATDGGNTYDAHGEYWGDPKLARYIVAALDATRRMLPPAVPTPARPLPSVGSNVGRALLPPRSIGA